MRRVRSSAEQIISKLRQAEGPGSLAMNFNWATKEYWGKRKYSAGTSGCSPNPANFLAECAWPNGALAKGGGPR
jgi:hypothetical protein